MNAQSTPAMDAVITVERAWALHNAACALLAQAKSDLEAAEAAYKLTVSDCGPEAMRISDLFRVYCHAVEAIDSLTAVTFEATKVAEALA